MNSLPIRNGRSALVLLAALSLSIFSKEASAQNKIKVNGFLPTWSGSANLSDNQFTKLSYVIIFSIPVPTGGDVTDDFVLANLTATGDMIDLATKGKESFGTGVLLCVGGSGIPSNGFSAMAGDVNARHKFATSSADFCSRNGLAGIDIDWEFPGDADKANFEALAKEMHTAFSGKGLVISTNVNGPETYHYTAAALQQFDMVQIMSYDNEGWPATQNHSTINDAQNQLAAYKNIIGDANKKKILLGVPFFGKNSNHDALAYTDILKANPGLSPTADNSGAWGFNGTTTLAAKTNMVIDGGYGGIMIWQLLQDAPDSRLLNSIGKAVTDKTFLVEHAKPTVSNRFFSRAVRLGEPLRSANGFLTLLAPAQGSYHLTLSSISGKLVKTWPATSVSGQAPLRWQSNGLTEGTYLYHLEGNTGKLAGRIIVQP